MFNYHKFKSIVYAISVLAGTIIGVGLFSLPYLTLQVGWLTILLYFVVLGSLITLLHILFGELVLKTPDHKRLPGIAEYYYGKAGKIFTLISHSVGLFGAMLAYIIVGGGFFRELLLSADIDISLTLALSIFLMLGGLIMFLGSSALNKIQFIGILGFFLAIAGLTWIGWDKISVANIFARNGHTVSWFAPYGAIMFSLWGATMIPQVEDILGKNKKYMTKVIITSITLSAIVYLFFIVVVLGISGSEATPSALISLGDQLGQGAEALILIFGLITTFTSFVAIGTTLTQVLEFDLNITKIISWLITLFLPLTFYLSGVKDFLEVVVFLGSVLLAIDGLNILFLYHKGISKTTIWRHFIIFILAVMLLGGIIYEISTLYK